MITQFLRKIYLNIYRFFGFTFLLVISSSIFTFLGLMGFFFINSSWIAPTVLTPTSDKMLQFSAGYSQAQQNYATVVITHDQAARELDIAKQSLGALENLNTRTVQYNNHLQQVSPTKEHQLIDEAKLARQLDVIKQAAIKNQSVGLLTNTDLVTTLSSITLAQSNASNDDVAWHTTNVQAAVGTVQLATQILQVRSDLITKHDTVAASEISVQTAKKTLGALERSAYMHAFTNDGANLAFLPYDNVKSAKIGAPVYDCYMLVLICHKVGVVKAIYHDELIVDFPVFNVRFTRTVRGTLLELDMIDAKHMKSSLFFVGGKPLLL